MALQFKERSTLGAAWSLEVRRSLVLIGHVRRNPSTGGYQYFHGPDNVLTPSREDADLESLKGWVETAHGR